MHYALWSSRQEHQQPVDIPALVMLQGIHVQACTNNRRLLQRLYASRGDLLGRENIRRVAKLLEWCKQVMYCICFILQTV